MLCVGGKRKSSEVRKENCRFEKNQCQDVHSEEECMLRFDSLISLLKTISDIIHQQKSSIVLFEKYAKIMA